MMFPLDGVQPACRVRKMNHDGVGLLHYYAIIFGGAAFLAVVLGVTSLTYFHATIRVLVLYLVAMAALVFALRAPQAFAQQLYLPESLDRFLVLWLFAVVPLTIKRLWVLWS